MRERNPQTSPNIPPPPGAAVIPTNVAAMIMRGLYQRGAHWFFVCDQRGLKAMEGMITHFANAAPGDLQLAVVAGVGGPFAVAAASKAKLATRQFQKLLRNAGVFMSRDELRAKDILIAAETNNLDAVTALADRMLSDPNAPRVPAPPPMDARPKSERGH